MAASTALVASCTASMSRMSPRMNETRESLSALSTLLSEPRTKLSRITILAGEKLRSRRSIVAEPMRPQPPVTRMLEPSIFIAHLVDGAASLTASILSQHDHNGLDQDFDIQHERP